MSGPNSFIKTSELDFDLIKANLIDYFKSDPTFQDYEFEGSALNILLDILSANTHMNAVIANMSANEMFIDSAQLRQSIVSIAKALGYTPRSKRTAKATITLSFSGVVGSPQFLTMPAGTRFSTPAGMIFSTKDQYLIYPKEGGSIDEYEITGVDIYEGVFNNFKYTVDTSDVDQVFNIPSLDADISTLTVTNIVGSTSTLFTRNENITLADSDSKVYFIDENADGTYKVYFGDGIIGFKPINASTVSLTYIISQYGSEANGSSVFQKSQQIDGYSTYTITTTENAFGAAERESKESIATRAPQMYKAQSRSVVTQDYVNFMLAMYPWIDTMNVWGGEYNEPPVYGKVFISIKPSHTEFLSESLKDEIKAELISKYNVVTVIPEIVDPEYLYVLVNSDVVYNVSNTTLSVNELIVIVNDAIVSYFEDNASEYNTSFYYSNLATAIDTSDQAIVSSLTSIKMMKRFYPILSANEIREIDFNNPITAGSVVSSYYNLSGVSGSTAKQQIVDDGEGILYTRNVLTNEIIDSNVGTVDYEAGTMTFTVTVYEVPPDTKDVRIYCTPQSLDLAPGYNQIIFPDESPKQLDYGRQQGITISTTVENKEVR